MLVACFLGIGFMILFFIALVGDGKRHGERLGVAHSLRPRAMHHAANTVYRTVGREEAVVETGAHISMGVLRITTALSSNPIRENDASATNRPHIVMFPVEVRKADSTTGRLIARN
jgi:hypothetical protein